MEESINNKISYYEADFSEDILQFFEDYLFLCKEMIKEKNDVLQVIEQNELSSTIYHNNFSEEQINHIKANEDFYIDRIITHFKDLVNILKKQYSLKFIADNLHDQFGIEEFNDEIYSIIKEMKEHTK